MIKTKIIHNPKAGDEEHSHQELIKLIESRGFHPEYSSIKDKDWEYIDHDIDCLVVAGGDGTVRKVVKKLLERKMSDKRFPLAVLPLGTANNLALTLGLPESSEEVVDSWKNFSKKRFDAGLIYGFKEARFFLEGMGCGVFPELISKMKKVEENMKDTPEKKLEAALTILNEIVSSFEPDTFEIEVDGMKHTGKYLLVEIMNIRSIGPNLILSPDADPYDGWLDLVLIPEDDREQLSAYVKSKIDGEEIKSDFNRTRCQKIKITSAAKRLHVDDELFKLEEPLKIEIQIQDGLIDFLT